MQLSRLLMNPQCLVEEAFGVRHLLDALPLLYFLAEWREGAAALARSQLPLLLAQLAINLVHNAVKRCDGDAPRDLQRYPPAARAGAPGVRPAWKRNMHDLEAARRRRQRDCVRK